MTTRQDIADALSTVTGITGSASRPTVVAEGAAWPQVASHDRDDGYFMTTWSVYVVMPADDQAAADTYDSSIATLRAALHAVVYVDRDEPVLIPTESGDIFAILITARSE